LLTKQHFLTSFEAIEPVPSVEWLRDVAVLGDDMGLGTTVATLTASKMDGSSDAARRSRRAVARQTVYLR
jgi:hypothetical protein